MVSNTPNSENGTVTDITYVMPAFAGLPGLQEAARAFSRSGAFSEESQAVRAQLALVADQGVSDAFALVDDDQLGKAKIEALSRVPAGPVGSYSAVQEIVNKIKSSNDPREVMSLSSQLDAAINSTERLKGEEQDPETKEQKIDRLWAGIDEAEENIAAKMKKKLESGEITQEQYNLWKEDQEKSDSLQAKAEALPAGLEKDAATQAAAVATAKAADTASDHLGADDVDVKAVKTYAQTIVSETRRQQDTPSVSQEAAQNNPTTITLGGAPKQASEVTYAYEDISNEHSGTLALQQGGTKDITLNQGKGGASI